MAHGRFAIIVTILIASFSGTARTALADETTSATRAPTTEEGEEEQTHAPLPWERLPANAFDAYIGLNSLFHVAGVAATAAMAPTGVDYHVYRFFAENREAGYIGAPALMLGYVGPVVVVGGLYLYGWRAENDRAIGAGSAVLQALAFSAVHTTILKVFTGRPSPHDADDLQLSERETSEKFRFGFMRGGFIKGWPSGHTGAAVAIGVTLATYYDAWWIDILGYASVAYMGYSMVAYRGGYHWASDVAAAALMNFPIARTVGKSFRALVTNNRPTPRTQELSIAPTMLYDGSPAIIVGGVF